MAGNFGTIIYRSKSHDINLHSYPSLCQLGESALTVAAGAGHIGVVKLLLDAKANVNRANKVVYHFFYLLLIISTTQLHMSASHLTRLFSCSTWS